MAPTSAPRPRPSYWPMSPFVFVGLVFFIALAAVGTAIAVCSIGSSAEAAPAHPTHVDVLTDWTQPSSHSNYYRTIRVEGVCYTETSGSNGSSDSTLAPRPCPAS